MFEKHAFSVSVAFEVITAPIILAGLVGNFIICALIIPHKKMRTTFNYLLLNLAVSDFMCCLIGALFYAAVIRNHYFTKKRLVQDNINGITCKIAMLAIDINTKTSVFTLAAVSTDRFYAVVRPLQHRKLMSKRNIWVLIGFIWCLSTVSAVPLTLLVAEVPNTFPESSAILCLSSILQGETFELVAFVDLVAAYFIPTTIITITSYSVFRHLWSSRTTLESKTSQALLKYRKRITKIIISVIVAFNMFWLPWAVMQALFLAGAAAPAQLSSLTLLPLISLVLASASINPLLYSLQSQQFRRQVRKRFKLTC